VVDDRPATAEEMEGIHELMRRVQQIRELKFVHDVEVRVQSKTAMRKYMREQLQKQSARVERVYTRSMALGVLDPKTTREELLDEASDPGDVLGYYDPVGQYLVLRHDLTLGVANRRGDVQSLGGREVVVHELTHALQDQHFDLNTALDRLKTSDQVSAYMAVVEGDATLTEVEHILGRWGKKFRPLTEDLSDLDNLINGLPPTTPSDALATPGQLEGGMFRYRAGVMFAAALWREGGTEGINHAFRIVPTSTEQIIDPNLYLDDSKREVLRLPPMAMLERAGYKRLYEDTLGRVELGTYLSREGSGGDLRAATWAGDRMLVLERNGRYSAVWMIRMTDIEDARAIADRAQEFDKKANGDVATHLMAFSDDYHVVIARNIDPKVQDELGKELTGWIDSGKSIKSNKSIKK
jgi:hypothetical protein